MRISPLSRSGDLGDKKLQPVIVYNIKLDKWTDSYEAPNTSSGSDDKGNSLSMQASPVADQEQPSSQGMPLGAKIGLIAGASSILLIVLASGAFLIRRRKMRKIGQVNVSHKKLPTV